MNMKLIIEEMMKEDEDMTVNDLIGRYCAEAMVFNDDDTKKKRDKIIKKLANYDADTLLKDILKDFK